MANNTRARFVPVILLLVVGTLALSIQFFQIGGGIDVAALGVTLLLGYYFWARLLRLIVPGLIMVGVGASLALDQIRLFPRSFEPLIILFLGVAFLLVYALHSRREASWVAHNWPLFPGFLLGALGAVLFLIASGPKQ